jgi:thiol-disulfide isomerase/thioredoxin
MMNYLFKHFKILFTLLESPAACSRDEPRKTSGLLRSVEDFLTGVTSKKILWFVIIQLLLFNIPAYGFEAITQDGICSQFEESSSECDELFPENTSILQNEKKGLTEFVQKPENKPLKEPLKKEVQQAPPETKKFIVYFFWGKGCPHCEAEKIFLNEMKKKYPNMEIKDFEVWYNKQNAELLLKMAKAYNVKASGVPVTFIDKNAFVGFSEQSKEEIMESIKECLSSKCIDPLLMASGKPYVEEQFPPVSESSDKTEDLECKEKSKTVHIPWIGKLEASEMSLPAITIVIAGLDSFNPCAFFVLFSLLGLLIHARSRAKMLLIGGVFVFFSGFIYFIFMAAWLNLFLVMGQVGVITTIAGTTAILIAGINIKDFFIFKKGISLTIPDSAKPKLFDRMRRLMKSTSFLSILVGTAVLAIAANSYELLCTAGFPMVFTRILTLNNLSNFTYYMYLILYNIIYVIPLLIIVVIFTLTLGKRNLTEWQGRVLKLVSGTMMLGLGGILLFDPAILNNAFIAFLLLLGAIVVAALTAFVTRKVKYSE